MRAASSRILDAICSWETSTPSMSGCRSSGCSAVVTIGSKGAVIAVAPSGAKGSSEREPVIPPLGDQPPRQADPPRGPPPPARAVPVGGEPVHLGDVAGRQRPGGRAGGDHGTTQHT